MILVQYDCDMIKYLSRNNLWHLQIFFFSTIT